METLTPPDTRCTFFSPSLTFFHQVQKCVTVWSGSGTGTKKTTKKQPPTKGDIFAVTSVWSGNGRG